MNYGQIGGGTASQTLVQQFGRTAGTSVIQPLGYTRYHSLQATADRFDVLHVHSPFSMLAAAAETQVPAVHTVHGAFTPDMTRLYGQVADRAWYVAISEAQRRTNPSLRYGGVVYNGIDLDGYAYTQEKDDYLLFLGRAAPEKGWRRAVETARLTGLRLISAVKIAHPTEQEEWERHIRPILPEGSEVLGEISAEHKADLLAHALAVLFPIDWDEPFGLVMTEAMACGTPVIATPRGSVPEVIADGETGWIVDVEGYAEAAAERLQRLDTIDPAACRERVSRQFSKEAMVAGYERVFAEVVASGA